MTYIITEPCVGVQDAACVDVCPVDCIYTRNSEFPYLRANWTRNRSMARTFWLGHPLADPDLAMSCQVI